MMSTFICWWIYWYDRSQLGNIISWSVHRKACDHCFCMYIWTYNCLECLLPRRFHRKRFPSSRLSATHSSSWPLSRWYYFWYSPVSCEYLVLRFDDLLILFGQPNCCYKILRRGYIPTICLSTHIWLRVKRKIVHIDLHTHLNYRFSGRS